jgi:signal transduction histidine kinase
VRPIYTLIQGTQRIARGEYSCVIIRSRDELHLLADSFNSMSEQLRQSREKLDATNRNLEETVRLRTKRLQEALQELQVLDKMKDEFLSSISHEFRTPLTSIKAFAEILLEERDPDTVSEFLGIILRESNRLEGLVNDVLDLVKMESGEMPFRFSETSPGAILRNSVQAARERAVEHHIRVVAQEEEMELLAMWDGAKITRLLLELLNNAIRFSPPGSQIQVTLSRRASGVRYAVRDQGPGLPPGDLERVFEKFRQIGEALTGKPMGAGLGLPICRLIAENHGGTIHAETPEGGGGALFVLDLPLDARVVSPVAHRRKAPPRAEVANEVPENLYEARESLV